MKSMARLVLIGLVLLCVYVWPSQAQQTLGSISGTVTDSSGGVIRQATVKIHNLGTGLEKTATTKVDGSFSFPDLPIGTYSVTFSRDGFKSEVHSEIIVQSDRTTTVNGSLQPGEVNVTVTVSGTPLMNQTDTTTGYVVDTQTIQETPLGTGSFTQLAILSPGVHADFLG
ncbi:MAG: carboxypeptidase-like regulatory domain-containing protein, partial [Candidatus Acidiferrum sp.]